MTQHILIIEDDTDIQELLKNFLQEEHYIVHAVGKGGDGLKYVQVSPPDLVILDLTLPDIAGETVCMQIRKDYADLPIIILTGKDDISTKVQGFKIGADDYVTKPFLIEELFARIQARLRPFTTDTTLIVGDLQLDKKTIEVKRNKIPISMTPLEFKFLEYLMENKGVVLTREMILNRIWQYSMDVESRVVDVYIGYLRKKIDDPFSIKLLHSVRGFGYSIKEPPESSV